MKSTSLKIVCTALLGAASLAWGQDDGVPSDDKGRTFGNGLLSETVALYDVDRSGALSLEEMQALRADRNRQGRHDRLRRLWDRDRNGIVDTEERRLASIDIRRAILERRNRRFNEVDLNSDDFLIEDEFLRINAVAASDLSNPGTAAELFKYLDHNRDRRISREEFLRSVDTARTAPANTEVTPKPRDDINLQPVSPVPRAP